MQKHIDMQIAPLISAGAVLYFAHGFLVFSKIGSSQILHPKLPNLQKKSTFLHLLLQSLKKIWGYIDKKIFHHQLEQEKLFNLITNIKQIDPSNAEKY